MVSRRIRFVRWWGRAGMGIRAALMVSGVGALALLIYLQRPHEDSSYTGSNLLVFALLNLNIVLLILLAFLIGRNVVKLIFDRRRNILGSKLRSRLVTAFVALALIPTVILFILASGLLNRAIEGWFSEQVETSVSGAVEVARHHYAFLREVSLEFSKQMADEIRERPLIYRTDQALKTYLEEERHKHNLFSIRLMDSKGSEVLQVSHAASGIEDFHELAPDPKAIRTALNRDPIARFEERNSSQFVRTYASTRYNGKPMVLVTTLRVLPDLTNSLTAVNDAFKEYQQLRLFKNPLKSGYLLTLSMITALILFSAIWFGFYIARELTGPIQKLAEAMKAVARGDYSTQLRPSGDDEIGFLVQAFNRMTSDLKRSKDESDARQVYIETIVSNLGVGVVGISADQRVRFANAAAQRLFGTDLEGSPLEGVMLEQILPSEVYEEVVKLLGMGEAGGRAIPSKVYERELLVSVRGQERKIVCTSGPVYDQRGRLSDTILLFDDVTELAKTQQLSAWREVARRIAHEIKNPLTPIQLSAQRIENVLQGTNMQQSVHESVQTIVEHVGSIKRLADEFSKFARMPEVEYAPVNLNQLVSETLLPFAERFPDVVIQFIAANDLFEIELDREQVRRVIINLVDNAIVALENDQNRPEGEKPRITVKTGVDTVRHVVILEIADNGPGIPQALRHRIFEPYVTTKEKGAGLGLAIVSSIIVDHHGDIRVYEVLPRGTKFIIEFPVTPPTAQSQRRLVSG